MSESLGEAFGCAFMGALKGALTCWFLPFWLTWSKLWVVVPNKCKSPTKPMVSRGYLILWGWVSINSPKGIVFFMALWQIAWRLLQMEWVPMLVRTIKNVNHLSTLGCLSGCHAANYHHLAPTSYQYLPKSEAVARFHTIHTIHTIHTNIQTMVVHECSLQVC
jgi:hypothetical protein